MVIDQQQASKIKHTIYLGIEMDQFLNWGGGIFRFSQKDIKKNRNATLLKRNLTLSTAQSMYKSIGTSVQFISSVQRGIKSIFAYLFNKLIIQTT